ncbi:MAG: twin-arginine translocation signal domain-containing protein [Gammaproteobacteria bacterium]|nr:twin-arginine translocation signal domain-containing protein [Gammaproteobacteria bacterium]
MKKDENKNMDTNRRNFLCGSAAAGAGVVLAAVVPASAVAAPEKELREGDKGYHLTQHITDYYNSAAS